MIIIHRVSRFKRIYVYVSYALFGFYALFALPIYYYNKHVIFFITSLIYRAENK